MAEARRASELATARPVPASSCPGHLGLKCFQGMCLCRVRLCAKTPWVWGSFVVSSVRRQAE